MPESNRRFRQIFLLATFGVFGCTSSESISSFVIVGPGDAGHQLTEVTFPELVDPKGVQTAHLSTFRGGTVDWVNYAEGGPLSVDFTVTDGVAMPHDEDGLILWSFAYYLNEIHGLVGNAGLDLEGLMPVRMAYAPDLGDDLFGFMNAAWVCGTGTHLFLVLPDYFHDYVPVAAHQGVIRHEYGHALFGHLTTGFSPSCPEDANDLPGKWIMWNEVNEGFADILATLTLDDPVFIETALPVTRRDVRSEVHVASEALYLEGLETNDPYLVGSVVASFAWDIRDAVGPERPLAAAFTAAQGLRSIPEQRDPEELLFAPDEFVLLMVQALAGEASTLAAACAALDTRFPHLEASECSSSD